MEWVVRIQGGEDEPREIKRPRRYGMRPIFPKLRRRQFLALTKGTCIKEKSGAGKRKKFAL